MKAHRHLDGILLGSRDHMYSAVKDVADGLDIVYAKLGINPSFQDTQGSQAPNNPPPSPAQFTVTGANARFHIVITNPQNLQPKSAAVLLQNAGVNLNSTGAAIYHQLQSAVDTNFNANSNVSTYGPTTDVVLDIGDPNTTKFWRLRSSFDQVNWNAWQIFQSAAVCGPVAIWSGLVASSASGIVDSATTPEGGSPLTQHALTMQIDVAASTYTAGDQSPISYNSGSVTPASFGTWLVYAIDQFRKGGTVTYIATQNSADITNSLYSVYFGSITTASGGGGTGSGGGGGTCCRAGVPHVMYDGTSKDCSLVEIGETMTGADGGPERVEGINVIPARPCFHLEFDAAGKLTVKTYIGDFTVYRFHLDRSHTFLAGANGIIDGACSQHVIQYAGGGFTDVFSAIVGETFNLQNGAVGAHNVEKLNT